MHPGIGIRGALRPWHTLWRATCCGLAALAVGSGAGSTVRWLVGRAYSAQLATGVAIVFGIVAAFTALVIASWRLPQSYRRHRPNPRQER